MRDRRETYQIDEIILHCSATPNGRFVTVRDIDAWHREREFHRNPELIGYNQPRYHHIGYHFVIYSNGPVVIGRGLREAGAHCYGHNQFSIGICLIGTDQFSPLQWRSLSILTRGLRNDMPTICRVVGHHEYNKNKTCPGFDVQAWVANSYRPLAGHILETQAA